MFKHICAQIVGLSLKQGIAWLKKQEQNDWIETLITEYLGGRQIAQFKPRQVTKYKQKRSNPQES